MKTDDRYLVIESTGVESLDRQLNEAAKDDYRLIIGPIIYHETKQDNVIYARWTGPWFVCVMEKEKA